MDSLLQVLQTNEKLSSNFKFVFKIFIVEPDWVKFLTGAGGREIEPGLDQGWGE